MSRDALRRSRSAPRGRCAASAPPSTRRPARHGATAPATIEAVPGGCSDCSACGSAFSGSSCAVSAEDLVFVEVARAQPRHEQLPEPADIRRRIGIRRPSQSLKSPTTLTRLRVRRPHRERDSLDALMHHRVRSELPIAGEVVALDQQMNVDLAEHRRERIDVVELATCPPPLAPQPIAERLLAVRHRGDEEPIAMQALDRAPRSRRSRRRSTAIVWAPGSIARTYIPAERLVHAEKARTDRRAAPRRPPRSSGSGRRSTLGPPRSQSRRHEAK